MHYTTTYHSPLGDIILACDDIRLIGLWFHGQKHFGVTLSSESLHILNSNDLPSPLFESILWLDIYFAGKNPKFIPPIQLSGKTITYGEIAILLAKQRGVVSISAQAVGNAVGRNPISIIIPCHRVIGANGSLTGYAGGIDKKLALLKLENH